jgi:hypothetical protein
MRLTDVTAAELGKLRTLPVAVLAVAATTVVGGAIAAALASSLADQRAPVSVTAVTIQAVPFVQVGLILLGVLSVTHEHTGSQLRTTLAVVPRRGLLLAGKSVATLVAVALTAVATVGAILAAAAITAYLLDVPDAGSGAEPWPVLGSVAYLVLVGLLSHAVALLVRHLIPALAGMLGLVLIVSPLLAGLTEHARWLPDRAAMQLYDPADTMLTPATGALVMLAWTALVGGAATALFVRRDP